jgi:hypothetical protein
VVRVDVSRGYLAKLIGKVSESLASAYAELFGRLPGEAVLNIDETGHKENGAKFWTWCFRAQVYTLFHFGFSWLDFATAPTLADVEITFGASKFERANGTRSVVSSLREADLWRGEDALKRLQRELSRMISPFRAIRNFIVAIEADGKPIDLEDITDKVRDLAPVRYTITFDGKRLSIVGRARLDFFRPPNTKEAEEFALIAESDDGDCFFNFLKEQKKASYINLKKAGSKKWFVEFRRDRNIDDLDRLDPDPLNGAQPANPRPFYGPEAVNVFVSDT